MPEHRRLRTQVAIIGAGPAGLLLQQLLRVAGIDSVILEARDRRHVESRIRAGVLEMITVRLLEAVGAGERMRREGLVHGGFSLNVDGQVFRIDMNRLTGGSTVMVYGQTEVVRDLIETALAHECPIVFEAEGVELHDLDGERPLVTWRSAGETGQLQCDFVAGCDGFHGVSRRAMPSDALRLYERTYPFAWLGILAEVPPCDHELVYSNHERGFALASMRSTTRSRYYVQTRLDEDLRTWPDERFWDEVSLRLDAKAAGLTRGPSIEKSLTPLRSLVAEPMRWKRLFLAGDAAHIVPPTGAKGMNLAASDVNYLAEALIAHYRHGSQEGLEAYSATALARVWKAERFSWWFTGLTHRFPDADPIERKLQIAELDYIRSSEAAQRTLAENYVGLPLI